MFRNFSRGRGSSKSPLKDKSLHSGEKLVATGGGGGGGGEGSGLEKAEAGTLPAAERQRGKSK